MAPSRADCHNRFKMAPSTSDGELTKRFHVCKLEQLTGWSSFKCRFFLDFVLCIRDRGNL